MSTLWEAPRIWPNGTAYIIGGGPSINDVNPEILRGKRIITTNNAYQLFPFAEFCFFFDFDWYEQHREGLMQFTGIKVTLAAKAKGVRGIKLVGRGSEKGIELTRTVVNHGVNSGHAAVNLAVHFGVKKIVLVGFDMRMNGDNHNYHRQHKKAMKDDVYTKVYIPNFDSIIDPLKELKVEIVNTTPGSGLTFFPFKPLEECL